MLECTNKLCKQNEKGKCFFYKETSYCQLKAAYEFGLALEISPHTPSYAEEQLEHAKEQENKKIKETVNKRFEKLEIENKELKEENVQLHSCASEATQQYLKVFDENNDLKAEVNQLRNERQETEFKLKRYAASEIGYKKIILGLTEALKELSKNIFGDENIGL